MQNPEEQLWRLGDRKWWDAQVRTFGLQKARGYLQEKIDERDRMKKEEPERYHRLYEGM